MLTKNAVIFMLLLIKLHKKNKNQLHYNCHIHNAAISSIHNSFVATPYKVLIYTHQYAINTMLNS